MVKFLKVEGNTSLVRDVSSNAIVNANTNDYEEYMRNREIALKKNDELNNLKQEVSEIKQMLQMLIKGKE